jgi:hypothetical protein
VGRASDRGIRLHRRFGLDWVNGLEWGEAVNTVVMRLDLLGDTARSAMDCATCRQRERASDV